MSGKIEFTSNYSDQSTNQGFNSSFTVIAVAPVIEHVLKHQLSVRSPGRWMLQVVCSVAFSDVLLTLAKEHVQQDGKSS